MAKYGFLDVLDATLAEHLHYDYEINWDKRNHAVEVAFLLEAQNTTGIEVVDVDGESSSEDILLEEVVLFYNPDKSRFELEDYLVALPFDTQKGLSREFLVYFAQFLNETADHGLDELLDFLTDGEAEAFSVQWDAKAFETGLANIKQTEFYPYPRY